MRQPVDSGLGAQRISPRATPVNTYAAVERSGLSKLAEGLAAFEPALGRFTAQTLDRRAKEQSALGQTEALRKYEEDRAAYKDAVANGELHQAQDPWFRLGMRQQFAQLAAGDYLVRLNQKATEALALGENNPEAFYEMEREERAKFIDENVGEENRNPQFDIIFLDAVEKGAVDIANRFGQAAADNAVEQAFENVSSQAYAIAISGAEDSGERLNALLQGSRDMGLDTNRVARALAEAIADAVRDQGDESLAGLYDQVQLGFGALGTTSYGRDSRDAALVALDDTREVAAQREQAARQRTINNHMYEINDALAKASAESADGSIPRPVLQELAAKADAWGLGQEMYDRITNYNVVRAQSRISSDPVVVDIIHARFGDKSITANFLTARLNAGDITGRDYDMFMQRLKQDEAIGSNLSADNQDLMRRLEQFVNNTAIEINALGESSRTAITEAQLMLWQVNARQEFMDYLSSPEGQAASYKERGEFIYGVGARLRQDMVAAPLDPQAAQYLETNLVEAGQPDAFGVRPGEYAKLWAWQEEGGDLPQAVWDSVQRGADQATRGDVPAFMLFTRFSQNQQNAGLLDAANSNSTTSVPQAPVLTSRDLQRKALEARITGFKEQLTALNERRSALGQDRGLMRTQRRNLELNIAKAEYSLSQLNN